MTAFLALLVGLFFPLYASAAAPVISAWGDSLTIGPSRTVNWPYMLSTRLPRFKVNNFGVSGQVSSEIAARQGALIARVTIADNRIAVLESTPLTIDNQVHLPGAGIDSIHGSLAGVAGQLSRHLNTSYFVRDRPGVPVDVAPGTPFIVDDHATDINVIWAGRNDINVNNTDDTISNIQKMVAHVSSRRFVVLSVLNGADEGRGTAKYAMMAAVNQKLKTLFPDNYIDVRERLVANYDTTSEIDRRNHDEDIPPQSLRTDTQHLKPAGYEIVAQAVAQMLTVKGW